MDETTNKTNWFSLYTVRKNNKEIKLKYTKPTGTEFVSILIKKQNESLLEQIATDYSLDIEELKENFLQPCYYIPDYVKNKNKESRSK